MIETLEDRRLLSAVLPLVPALQMSRPNFDRVLSATTNRPAASTSPYGLTPSQVRHAYGIDQLLFGSIVGDGSGQTIAIIDAYNAPNIKTDLATFDSTFGLPAPPSFSVVGQTGTSTLPGTDPSGRGNSWAVETSLDVEWAHAVAPKANILLVEANSAYDSDLFAAINTARRAAGVSAVSMSWGGSEYSGQSSYDSYFTTPSGHNGVTFVASSGDSGAYDYNYTSTYAVEYPASSPNVMGVGGTRLTLNSSGNYSSESGWGNGTSSGTYGGSGGGISSFYSQPSYQNGIVTQTSTRRAVPDVAFLADPASGVAVIDSWDSPTAPWIKVGGTSLAAPMWAGVIALVNQGRAISGQGTLNGLSETLPRIYALPSTDFHDITTGNNGYAATTGFDLVTGRGTPIINKLVPDMVGAVIPTTPVPLIGSLTVTPSPVMSGTPVTLSANNVAESTGTATISTVSFYRETNGTPGLQIGSDTLLGTGTQSGTTWTLGAATTSFAPGNYTYYAVATDSAKVNSATAQTSLTIAAPTIGSLTVNPSSVNPGATVTLSANSVAETNGTVSSVAFYRETNGIAGLQVGSDTLVGPGTQNGSTWTASTSTTGFTPGTYTYYAVATDAANYRSGAASAQLAVTTPIVAPVNDMFANATVVSGTSFTVTGTNVGATKESGEPRHANVYGGKSVWWSWTAPSSGNVNLDTFGSNFDTVLAVYTGTSVSALTPVAANDDMGGGFLTSAVTFRAVAGTTYKIAVDGYGGASGNIVLNLSMSAAPATPANDNFANALTLTSNALTWTGTNVGATVENYEPYHAGNIGGSSIWFNWTAPTTRTVKINTHGSNFDTLLAVYTGSSLASLTRVASNDDDPVGGTLTSAVSFNATAGQTYRIAVDGYNGAAGNVVLNIA